MTERVRIHVYFGSLCKSELLDYTLPFEKNLTNILNDLGVSKDNHKRYVMKLTNGGIVDKNELLFHDDRVLILLKDEVIPFL